MTDITGSSHPSSDSLLRRPDVEKLVGLKRAWIYQLMRQGEFPLPVRLGDRAVAWRESDIAAWISERPTVQQASPTPEQKPREPQWMRS